MMPWLTVKREQADVMVTFIDTMRSAGGARYNPLTQEELVYRQEIVAKLQALKKD